MKRNYFKYIVACTLLTTGVACTKDLEDINKNPNTPEYVTPDPIFTTIQMNTPGLESVRRGSIGFCMMMVQQTATIKTDDLQGDKYLQSDNAGTTFYDTYNAQARNLSTIMADVSKSPDNINRYAATRIWRVLVMHRLTDLYGAIPYSKAGRGYIDNIYTPAYDSQSEIYSDMLKELDEAAQSFDVNKATYGTADVVYQGKIQQWKRLAYSLMLRLGMRLSKVDANLAQTWVKKAIAGGLMQGNEDNCKLQHEGPNQEQSNPISYSFFKFKLVELGDIKISKTFLNFLLQSNDPRLPVYMSLPGGNSVVANQKGLPNGLDANSFQAYPGGNDLSTYSTFNVGKILPLSTPSFMLTYAEVELMLAEAAVRGWIPDNAADHYSRAVTASMQQQSAYGVTIDQNAINGYLQSGKPFPASGTNEQLRVINEQYWVATFLNGIESYANWRRSGFPALTPVNYPGNATSGVIPRRLTYPQSEYSDNGKSVKDAIVRQGADTYLTRVWWDKQQ
ncbi:MAG TPA: SusD/RagB family nutrient-binding outer membrane lipoprotein [Chitinophaga sp.]|uniref:SusD/RagB family nutrient-binding outer membrane lipoprotein n=1 Tax=Chitinophaga sp. TaxID=1869181 RepID=UPI002C956FAD|nr:SusD/RagB family nutrient-binding outer membrane lipoprotein [Chitinophaga sp.]HVI44026.1 SusD/RagB family nutrient-binding outer membrane lipoprotein [Chitinophaga sp.]